MSTTVTYKGQTLTTVENQTKTLQTAGTWVEGDFTLTDVTQGGESYETEFLELKNIIEGNVTEIDNSTITKWAAGLSYQNRFITKHVWREMEASGNNQFLRGVSEMTLCVFPKMISTGSDMFWNCTKLAVADFGALRSNFGLEAYTFENCPALTTLILRPNHVCKLNNTNAFNGTPFASGKTGGEIFVPSAQIENYKVATNWSTVDGWGTITWKAIEGSQYENYYADGSEVTA
jgi:hypothetical protein